jgi:hypothetical protein
MAVVLHPTSTPDVPQPIRIFTNNIVCTYSAYDVAIKLRPNADDLKELGPEFSARWNFFVDKPDKSIVILAPSSA